MFLGSLNDSEKNAFLTLAANMVAADGKLDTKEVEMLNKMKLEMNLPVVTESQPDGIEIAMSCFKTRKSKAAALLELIGLGYVDNDFDSEESLLLQRIAKQFGISEVELAAMENWVIRMLSLVDESAEFMVDKEV